MNESIKKPLLIFLMLFIFINKASAGGGPISLPATLGSQKNTDNNVYAGLVWNLGDKFTTVPQLTLGFRSLRVESGNKVNGGDISARFGFADGFVFDSWRFSYVGGKRDSLANVGLGYSINKKSILSTLGIQLPNLRVGSDLILNDKSFNPYLEVLTADSPDKVDKEFECKDAIFSIFDGSSCNPPPG